MLKALSLTKFVEAIKAKKKHSFIASVSLLSLVFGLSVVTPTQAAVTVQGSFSGLSVADVKGYVFNTSPVTLSMTTQTPFALDAFNSVELLRGGGPGFIAFTTNGSSNDCTAGCPYGAPELDGLTFTITDSANQPISVSDADIYIYDAYIKVMFSGNSPTVVPAGSTITFLFAPNKVYASPLSTDQIRTQNTDTLEIMDQTPVYKWFKTIIYQGNGGSATNLRFEGKDFVLSTDANPSTVLPSALYRLGYNITGWNTLANGTGTAYALGATFTYPAQSTNLYAQWEVAPRVVTFNANGGTGSLAQQSSTTATTLTLNNSNITKVGYSFNGWNTLPNGTGTAYANGASFPFSASATLYAQWGVAAKTVTFDANGGTGSIAAQSSAAAANLTSNTSSIGRTGYSFNGWNTLANGTGTAYANSASFPFSANTTLYAQWTANSNVVTYDSHGGSAVADGSFVTGGSIASLPAAPTRAGYTFSGWFAAATGGSALTNGYAPGATSSITLHAQWSGANNTVAYDSHGGSAVADGSFVTGGSISSLPAAPTRAGYTFSGWFAAANGGSALSDGYSPNVATGVTIHAQWAGLNNVITYESHGGSTVANGSFVTGDSSASLPAAPTRAGYTFQGWFMAQAGGTALNSAFVSGLTGDVTLHAQWAQANRTASFNANGGSGSMGSQSGSSLAPLNLNEFTKTGYYFDHWNTQADDQGTEYANIADFSFASDITLFAQWRRIPEVVTASTVINVPVGSSIDNAPVAVTADGLLDQSGYTITVHSTPQVIERGTIWSGRLNTVVRLPEGLEAGWHRLVIEGTAADGTPWVESNYFEVSPTGVLLAKSAKAPGALANTGANLLDTMFAAAAFMFAGASVLGLVALKTRRRRLR